jgi:hypothetical protein
MAGEDRPEWWDEAEKILAQAPQWIYYKTLYRLELLEGRVELLTIQVGEILKALTQYDTKPVSAKINMEGTNMADISVRDTNAPLSAVVSFADVHGHPTAPSDVPQWSSSDPNVASVDASADPAGLAATVTILGPGATVIGVSSSGPDGSAITAQGTITVMSGEATSGEVTFSGAEEAPVEEPPVEEPPTEEPPVA